jgi:anti-sigma B factor antagonist
MNFHDNPLALEVLIAAYLARRLDPAVAEAFESHYLGCQDCFEELEAAELLRRALHDRNLETLERKDVLVLRFGGPATLIWQSRDLAELAQCCQNPQDSKVVLDLSGVSRIDSSGLGELMRMHVHLARSSGALKVVNPSAAVTALLRVTRMDTVIETYADENHAVKSFVR